MPEPLDAINLEECSLETLGDLAHIYATWVVCHQNQPERRDQYMQKAQKCVNAMQAKLDSLQAKYGGGDAP